jgi:hypothetical protein
MKAIFRLMRGSSRIAIILWGIYVLKIPNISSYRLFLSGILANLQEKTFSSAKWIELCPVVFAGNSGLCLLMPYARPLTDDEWESFDYQTFVNQEDYVVPAENKRDSFGIFYGRVVAVDYG